MNKNTFLTAILLSSSTAALSAGEVAKIQSHVLSTIEAKGSVSFVSTKTVKTAEGTFRPYVDLLPSGGAYDFVQDAPGDGVLGKVPGIDPGLEYQVVTRLVNIATGEAKFSNAQYFGKVKDGKIKVYYCDTTAVCSEDRGTKEISVEGDTIVVSAAEFFGNGLSGDLDFVALTK